MTERAAVMLAGNNRSPPCVFVLARMSHTKAVRVPATFGRSIFAKIMKVAGSATSGYSTPSSVLPGIRTHILLSKARQSAGFSPSTPVPSYLCTVMSGKTYHVGITCVEDLTPRVSTFSLPGIRTHGLTTVVVRLSNQRASKPVVFGWIFTVYHKKL